jgi:transketolase
MNKSISEKAADNIRILSAAMVEQAKSGHPGGAMGGADFINILFSEYLKFDPSDPQWFMRDRFFLDPGHMSGMLYSVLALCGKFTMDELKNFRQWGSPTPGHPEVDTARGIENTSGPLGQGHTMAVGAAIAERLLVSRFGEWMAHKTYTYISDGGIQEEISQGAGRIAGFLGLSNLIMFYDANDVQLSTYVREVTCEDTAAKYEAWGWKVLTINGNSHSEIRNALNRAIAETNKPTLIIGRTIMGKGILNKDGNKMEGLCSTHGQPISAAGADFAMTVKNLGGNPQEPFTIFDEVKAYYSDILQQKTAESHTLKAGYDVWAVQNAEKAELLIKYLNGNAPEIDYNEISLKENIATRAASAGILGYFARHIGNMIVMSADLANSDRTDGFLEKTRPIAKGDFSGAFLHAGVSELTMAALANGMALHGGIIPVCGTFFVFSDYMKPAVRLSALMQLPVKYVWTHDAFRVGEDGPTHQPVEQEAQIRLLEQLKNHSGKNSMLVLRPADQAETITAWKMALENTGSPAGLILSRQNIQTLPAIHGKSRIENAAEAAKGAYIVQNETDKADIILIASGSEVSLLVASAGILAQQGIHCRVVSVISEGLFRSQPVEYQKEIIPANLPVFGVTAGLPSTLAGLTGCNGRVHGLSSFGYSAPASVLDEKFGFTPQNIAAEIIEFLKK